jgi:DNA invertase Pin-like site-specific DNA recombinase
MKAAGYIRVSTEEQARGGVSLEAQDERVRAYCTSMGLSITQVVREEGVSGAMPLGSRPGGSALLGLLKSSGAKHIVCLKLDRLFRDAEDALRQTRVWERGGIALHVIDMGGSTLNTASAMGRMFLTLTAAFAELERNLIAERTAAALAHKKRHREAYSPTPFGFDRHGATLVANQGETETVASILTRKSEGWSFRKIAAELNDLGITGKKGGRWYASTVRYVLANKLHQPST